MPARNTFRRRCRLFHRSSSKRYFAGGDAASWPIVDRWSIVGAYYFDTNTNKAADQMLGLQYNSCCYAIRGYERKINGWDNNTKSKYDNVIGFNIELRGLSSNYGLGTQQMLRSNILPYQSSLYVLDLQRNPLCG
jgi:LPS-assembly protein